jgi:RNA polymerase sigma factor (sigma-70 family)
MDGVEDSRPTRQTLLERLRDVGDDATWRDFFETYWKLIYKAGRKAGLSDVEAQDLVQETVISVHKKMPAFRYDPARGTFRGWLLKLTWWRITDQLRKRRSRETSLSKPDRELDIANLPQEEQLHDFWEAEWERNMMDAAIERAKAKVHPKQFQIFDLYVLREGSVTAVASRLKISAAQVYLAKHRVGNAVKAELRALKNTEKEL